MRWWDEVGQFKQAMGQLFKFGYDQRNNRSISAENREMSLDTLMSRVTDQIIEYDKRGLSWSTPEDWDKSRETLVLDGYNPRALRKSSVILERVRWDTFLELLNKILNNRTKN